MVTTRAGVDTNSETPSPRSVRKRGPQEDPSISQEAKRKRSTAAAEQRLENGIEAGEHRAVPLRTKNPTPQPTLPSTPPATAARKHIRFSSTSPPPAHVPLGESAIAPAGETAADDDSDDDAAPEAISHSAAQAQSRATQAEAVKADRAQKNAKKVRRRKRDRELKAQAQGSEKRKEKDEKVKQRERDAESEGEEEVGEVEASPKKLYNLDNLPALLPDELLATEAPIRPPTPPPSAKTQVPRNKKTTFDSSTAPLKAPQAKPPVDLTVGDMRVRVMAKTNPLLPPKASESAKSLREGWLKGRSAIALDSARGRKKLSAGGKLQRRTFGGSSRTF